MLKMSEKVTSTSLPLVPRSLPESPRQKWAQVVMETLEEESESSDERELSSDDDCSDEEFEHRENRASEKANDIAIVPPEEQDGVNELQEEYARLVLERTKTRHHHSSPSKHTKSAKKSR
jgi:hypothetical protein